MICLTVLQGTCSLFSRFLKFTVLQEIYPSLPFFSEHAHLFHKSESLHSPLVIKHLYRHYWKLYLQGDNWWILFSHWNKAKALPPGSHILKSKQCVLICSVLLNVGNMHPYRKPAGWASSHGVTGTAQRPQDCYLICWNSQKGTFCYFKTELFIFLSSF